MPAATLPIASVTVLGCNENNQPMRPAYTATTIRPTPRIIDSRSMSSRLQLFEPQGDDRVDLRRARIYDKRHVVRSPRCVHADPVMLACSRDCDSCVGRRAGHRGDVAV